MLSYCLKCKEDTKSINRKVSETSNRKTNLLSKCAPCNITKSRFIKELEASGLLSKLGVRTLVNKISLLGDFFLKKSILIKIILITSMKILTNYER